MSLQVKVCGITRIEDALAAVSAGADLIGLNFWSGTPRCVSVERACEIAEAVRGRVEIVALFVDAARQEILETAEAVGVRTVQLHGDLTADRVRDLGGLRVICGIRVGGQGDLARLPELPGYAYLLDARVEGMHGGTGRTINWELARSATQYGRILLAGGLGPDNVCEAVRTARPWGVDVASGVEVSPGIKDAAKVERFVRNAREADEGTVR